jgi:hypothetical protein
MRLRLEVLVVELSRPRKAEALVELLILVRAARVVQEDTLVPLERVIPALLAL